MLRRTEKYLERQENNNRVRPPTTNSFTKSVTEYEFVTDGGLRLVTGDKFRVKEEPGQLFTFHGLTTNKRGEQWIDCYGGQRPQSEFKHRRQYRAFPMGYTFLEPRKADR